MTRRFRPVRTVVGAATAVTALGFGAVAYKVGENLIDGDASGQNLEQQFNDAVDDTPVGPIISEANDIPVIGKADDAVQTALNRPRHEAEACQRVASDIRVEDQFQSQYETGKQIAAQIGLARTPGEIISLLDSFLDVNGVELYYNRTSQPTSFSRIEWATDGIDVADLQSATFDDSRPDATAILRNHAAGIVLGASHFSRAFNDDNVDYLILAGNVKDEASATAHNGILSNGIVIEMDGQVDVKPVAVRTAHEIAHTFQFNLFAELGVPNQAWFAPYDSLTPRGFGFAEAQGTTVEAIANEHPEYFTPGPDHAFSRPYSATNAKEHGATAVGDMLIDVGLVGEKSESWGSLYHMNQVNLLVCLDTAMPGYVSATVEHQLATGLIEDRDDYTLYLENSAVQLAPLLP